MFWWVTSVNPRTVHSVIVEYEIPLMIGFSPMPNDSTTRLVKRWQAGDDTVAAELSVRYAQQLCELAESSISRKLARHVNAEAIANSSIRTFLRRIRTKQIKIDHSGATWKLLAKITLNKVRKQAEYHYAKQRDVSREIPLESAVRDDSFAHNPSTEDLTALMDEIDHLLKDLQPQDARILHLILEENSVAEIAEMTDCSRWTVRRTLNRIGTQLKQRLL